MTLDPEDVEAVAARVAELLAAQPTTRGGTRLVSAADAARALGVSREWVYAHVDELGGIRLGPVGPGRRPPVRFDLDRALAAFRAVHAPAPRVARKPSGRASKPEHVTTLIDYDGAA